MTTPEPTDASEPEPRSEAWAATAEESAPEPDDELDDPKARVILQKLRRENASLRSRLHEREEEIGAQAARETVHHLAAVEAAAAQAGFIDPSDFTLAHPDPTPFLDEQFQEVVGDRVREAAEALLEVKPHLRRPVGIPPTDRPLEGLRGGASPEPKKLETTWSSALRGR